MVYINGIHACPADAEGWTDRAVTATHGRTSAKAEKWEYATSFATRWLKQEQRIQAVYNLVRYMQAYGHQNISMCGHSNGAAIVAGVLRLLAKAKLKDREAPGIRNAHLIAAAADRQDFEDAIRDNVVQHLYIYGSRNDRALKLAKRTRCVLSLLGRGYGWLGLEGAEFARDYPAQVTDCSNHLYDHSDWFQRGSVFDDTMTQIFTNEGLPCIDPVHPDYLLR